MATAPSDKAASVWGFGMVPSPSKNHARKLRVNGAARGRETAIIGITVHGAIAARWNRDHRRGVIEAPCSGPPGRAPFF